MQEEFVPFHQQLLVKCWVTNPPKDVDVLNKWFIDLVATVGMHVVAGPTSVYVDYPGNEGLTGTVTLATSHASVHIWDSIVLPMVQFDIYSYKPFELNVVMGQFVNWGIINFEWMMIDRNNGLSVVSEGKWDYTM